MTPGRFERALAFEREVMRRVSTRVERFAHGTAYLDDGRPHRYSSNLLWVDVDAAPTSAAALADEAERILGGAGLAHRKVNVDGESGRMLAPGFLELGWSVDRLVLMTLERAPDRRASMPVDVATFEDVRPVVETIARRFEVATDDAVLRELVGFKGHVERTLGARFVVTRVDGHIAAECEVYAGDGVAQIEDVNTLEEFRGRGAARAVVLGAAELARADGAELVFLVADDEDWPERLYGRLGFDRAGPAWEFVRVVRSDPRASPRGSG
jgi:ribosomal protein S18 acetylase RimI-like enzyme